MTVSRKELQITIEDAVVAERVRMAGVLRSLALEIQQGKLVGDALMLAANRLDVSDEESGPTPKT